MTPAREHSKVVNLNLHRISAGAPVPDDLKPFAAPERDWVSIVKAVAGFVTIAALSAAAGLALVAWLPPLIERLSR